MLRNETEFFVPSGHLQPADTHALFLEEQRRTIELVKSDAAPAEKQAALRRFQKFAFYEMHGMIRAFASITPILQSRGSFWVDSSVPTAADPTIATAIITFDPRRESNRRPEQLRWPYARIRFHGGVLIEVIFPTPYAIRCLDAAFQHHPRLVAEFGRVSRLVLRAERKEWNVDHASEVPRRLHDIAHRFLNPEIDSTQIRSDLPWIWIPGGEWMDLPRAVFAALALLEFVVISEDPRMLLDRSMAHPLQAVISMVDEFHMYYRTLDRQLSSRVGYDSQKDFV